MPTANPPVAQITCAKSGSIAKSDVQHGDSNRAKSLKSAKSWCTLFFDVKINMRRSGRGQRTYPVLINERNGNGRKNCTRQGVCCESIDVNGRAKIAVAAHCGVGVRYAKSRKVGAWGLGCTCEAKHRGGEREARVNQPNYTAQKSGAVPDMGSA